MVPLEPEGVLLDRSKAAPFVGLAELAPPGGLLVLVPHPDDETLGCGLALAAAADAGRRIAIVQLTDGEGSHSNSAAYPRDALKALRSAELDDALAALVGVARVDVLRLSLPDGRSRPSHLTPELMDRIVGLAETIDAKAVWTTWKHDPHCDHATAGVCAERVAGRRPGLLVWSYAVWGRFGTHGVHAQTLVRFASPEHGPRKNQAIGAYRSQLTGWIADDPTAFRMPDALVRHFALHPEIFVPQCHAA